MPPNRLMKNDVGAAGRLPIVIRKQTEIDRVDDPVVIEVTLIPSIDAVTVVPCDDTKIHRVDRAIEIRIPDIVCI